MRMHEPMTLGRWMKRLRADLDLTQEALAEELGCAAQTIRTFEIAPAARRARWPNAWQQRYRYRPSSAWSSCAWLVPRSRRRRPSEGQVCLLRVLTLRRRPRLPLAPRAKPRTGRM